MINDGRHFWHDACVIYPEKTLGGVVKAAIPDDTVMALTLLDLVKMENVVLIQEIVIILAVTDQPVRTAAGDENEFYPLLDRIHILNGL